MASVPGPVGLPMLYQDLVPLSSQMHATWSVRPLTSLGMIANIHAIPLTVEEFPFAQRSYPIVFSNGGEPVPLVLMGLNEGANVFVKPDGSFADNIYLPAYLRRYPFMLARLQPDSEEMSLCFDPQSGLVGEYDDGTRLFTDEGQPAKAVTDMLSFCEQFEIAAQRTAAFMKELGELGLAEDGELTIQPPGSANPYTYRGFGMVNEEKLRDLRGDQLRKMNQSGMLSLIHAHLFSLTLSSEIFSRQMEQGKVPPQQAMPAI